MKRVFVFDLDGTLIDSIGMISSCFNHIAQTYDLNPIEIEKFNYLLGDGPKVLVDKALDYLIERDNLDEKKVNSFREKLYQDYISYYNGYDDNETKLYPHIKDSLDDLKSKGAKLCICTNKTLPAAEKILDKLFGKNYFDYISALEDETKKKPNTFLLDRIIEKLDITKDEIVYFGDTDTDILTCKNANVTSVGVEWGFRDRKELLESGADYIIDDERKIVDFYGELPKSIR